MALEGKMERFCEEYIVDYNPVRATFPEAGNITSFMLSRFRKQLRLF